MTVAPYDTERASTNGGVVLPEMPEGILRRQPQAAENAAAAAHRPTHG